MSEVMKEQEKSFEFYLKELDRLLNDIENKNIDNLDEFINSYEYGVNLIEKCEKKLSEATLRIKKINERLTQGRDT